MATKIQGRRDTAANWTAANPILADGEFGVEEPAAAGQPPKMKIGDDVTAWAQLPYFPAAPAAAASWQSGQFPRGFIGMAHPLLPDNKSFTFPAINRPYGVRMRAPISGNITALYVDVGTVGGGNLLGGVYRVGTVGPPASPNRALLTALNPVAAVLGWTKLGNPNLPVNQDDWLDFVVACDSATTAIKHFASAAASVKLPTDLWPSPNAGGSISQLSFAYPAQGALALPAAAADPSEVTASGFVPGIFALIT